MKIRITHMKAPWPEGAQVGDVLKVDAIPAWAAGKCVEVDGSEKVTADYVPPEPLVAAEPVNGDVVKQLNDATALLAAQEETLADIRARALEFDEQLAAAEKARTEAEAETAKVKEQLAAAEKALAEATKPAEGKKAK